MTVTKIQAFRIGIPPAAYCFPFLLHFRYVEGRIFVYHNGAESYYGGRGFRGVLKV